jgi:hypothetical protein
MTGNAITEEQNCRMNFPRLRLPAPIGLPILIVIALLDYCGLKNGRLAKALTFLQFLPIVLIVTILWAGAWAMTIGTAALIWQQISH